MRVSDRRVRHWPQNLEAKDWLLGGRQAEGEAHKTRVKTFFQEVVRALIHFDTKTFGKLFYKPVTEKEAPDYFDVISHPISIKEIGCAG